MTLNIESIEEDNFCEHINTEYQPEEKDTNASEGLVCTDCGADLEPLEPDWDLEVHNSPLGAGFAHKDIKKG